MTTDRTGCARHDLRKSAAFGSKSLDEFCRNCGRDVRINLEVYSTEEGQFCGQNCWWSMKLDASNQRIRKSRKAVPIRRCKGAHHGAKECVLDTDPSLMPLLPESMAEYSHAMFQQALLTQHTHCPNCPPTEHVVWKVNASERSS
ncbi:hypothetical protein FVE85_7405 [Porphyridium purpureum]|uniref:Uncharacterized protein n=1 Tax=Porphyridium purpureum TaxID=35688 RepID=A0A5J4Z9L6_PORPP|nr:hypothetical protein FVE85_7405 [Porphyridium purpureum]|eukprot:POR4154..scf295_1